MTTTSSVTGSGQPSVVSRSPFERINGPEAHAALQEVYARTHRVVGVLLAAETLVAIVAFFAGGISGRWTSLACLLLVIFCVAVTFGRKRAISRQAAALCLFGFVALFTAQWSTNEIVPGLFFAALAVVTLYQDPLCVWPPGLAAVAAYIVVLRLGYIGDEAISAWHTAARAAVGFIAVGVCAYAAYSLRRHSLGSLRKQAVLTAENARITTELEKARYALLEATEPRSPGGSRSGLIRALANQDSPSPSRITEERYRMVIETAFDAIVMIDADTGLIVDLNPRALELIGRAASEVFGQEHVILYPPAKAAVYRAIFKRAAKGELRTLEIELADRNGTVIPAEVAFSVSRLPQQKLVQGVFRDLTERKRSEAEKTAITARLQEAQRLESLNVLAGGIAHDFNNILMSILGFATIGRDKTAESPVIAGYFSKIEASTLRAGELCRQMLAFAGRAQVSIHLGDLNDAIRSFEEPLRNKLPGHIQLEMHLWPELPPVSFDTAQLGQVVVSLVTNAIEAIAESPGLVQVKTYGSFVHDPTRNDGFITPEIPAEYCAVIEITDTGCGINPEHMRRVFEPFFSTKFIGRGLGLSETLGMIRSHKGAIQVKSKPGAGSTFRLYLPAAMTVLAKPSAIPITPAAGDARGETQLALVVDDDTSIRELVGAMLEDEGFRVHYAANGSEALTIFAEHPTKIGLVLLDLAMPGIPSHEVLEKIREAKRYIRVFMMSGYSEEDALERCGSYRPDGFLPKPFSQTHLKAALSSR